MQGRMPFCYFMNQDAWRITQTSLEKFFLCLKENILIKNCKHAFITKFVLFHVFYWAYAEIV